MDNEEIRPFFDRVQARFDISTQEMKEISPNVYNAILHGFLEHKPSSKVFRITNEFRARKL